MKRLSLLLICLIFNGTALGQCAPGIPGAGNPSCIPPDVPGSPGGQYRDSQLTRSTTQWESRWGSIAIDSDTSNVGTIADMRSASEAEEAALRACRSDGSKSCEVKLTYHDQCSAVAWGADYFGYAGAPYEPDAKKIALKQCQRGANSCKVIYSGCSLPARTQ